MAFQRLLFSGVLHIVLFRALADSSLFDDAKLLPDFTTFHPEDLALDDSKSFAQGFYDETETVSGYDDDFSSPSDSLLSTTSPSDISTLATADDLGWSFSSLYDEPDPDLSLSGDPGCLSDINQPINKREKGEMCTPTNSVDPLTPDQPFERGSASDPEFYGLPLAGYNVQLLSQEDEENRCRRDSFDLAQFLVCDSGLNADRFVFHQKAGIVVPGIALKNCERSTWSPLLLLFIRKKNSTSLNISAPNFLV